MSRPLDAAALARVKEAVERLVTDDYDEELDDLVQTADDGKTLLNAAPALIAGCETLRTIYAEIAKLPSPWDHELCSSDPDTNEAKMAGFCNWCHVRIERETTWTAWMHAEADDLISHPDNGCLWSRALAALDAAREEPKR